MGTLGFGLVPGQAMHATPALVAFASLLELAGPDVDAAVARELDENPALISDRPPAAAVAPPVRPARIPSPSSGLVPRPTDPPAPVSWRHALLRDVRLELPAEAAPVAAIVVGSLDDRGFLTEEPDAIAAIAGARRAVVDVVIRVVREVGPAGVAARDGRECLLLQIERIGGTDPSVALAHAIVDRHLADLAARRHARIAVALDVDVAAVERAHAFILHALRPVPSLAGDPGDPAPPERTARPDVAIARRAGDPSHFSVTVLEAARFGLHVDHDLDGPGTDVRWTGMVRRADGFLARLQERWATLHAIATYVAEREVAFLDGGPRGYAPLTRAAVAAAIGVHESTVSRATADKFVELPSRQVIPFATFFDTAQGVRALVRDVIDDAPRRLSDREVSARLAALGHRVARRTVAKYRRQLGIVVAPLH